MVYINMARVQAARKRQTKWRDKILRVYQYHEESLSLAELNQMKQLRNLKASNQWITSRLDELVKEGLLTWSVNERGDGVWIAV